uniref:Protein kinase domain-containing protein n=1 Tax=Skeletonema marinoi TaxID=267567 RepID=A0A7S2L4Y7_9STRA
MCQCEEPKNDEHHHRRRLNIQRSRTMRIMSSKATQNRTLASLYDIDWKQEPIGEGAFGHVLLATHKSSGERVAIKRIPKKLASHEDFQREMEALLRIQKWGGHPHICALREHFDEGGYYYLILDLVEGGEMFDHLVNHGAYSEADAARLVREVASALDFLHGIGVVHNDIKPENLMLSSDERTHGVVQIVDFGCAEVEGEDDDDDDIDTVTELEELKLDEEEMDQLLKDSSSKQGTTNETMVVDEEGVQGEEDNESADENVDKKNASGIDTVEEEALAVKMADEDDAFIPDEEVVEVAVGGKGGIEEDLDSTGTGDEVKEEDNEEEAVSVTDENDDQQLEEETESKAEIALDEGTDDEEMAEKLEEEMEEALDEELVQPKEEGEEIEAASETEDESVLCQDDPEFEYKGYEGFNCAYIKEKKPDKCDKKHEGVKVGLSSCPVSCDMVDECMALQQRKNDVVVSPTDETTTEKSIEAVADEQVSEDNSDDSATEQKDDMQLEKEMESELETALEQGTVDEETAEILDEEMLEALEEGVGGVFEKELEEELGLDGQEVSDDLSKEKMATEVDDGNNLATIDSSFTEDASSVVANITISEDDSSVCQDDPDFKFKGYEGFNCEYIKENKPGKCNKMFDGEKVGVVSCPVSCDMVDECMALRESKVDDALENATDNNVMGSNTTSEEDAVLTNTTAEASDDTNDQLLEGSEDTQVGAVLNTTEVVTSETETETSEELLKEQNTTSVDYSQATTIPSETQQVDDETGEDQILNDQELEQEIEAKLEKALEDGELDEEEAQELEYEMEEAIEEGVGKIFEAELDKELRCKDDPDFAIVDEDGQLRNCSWVRPNQRCESVHEYSGKVIGTFFCPETCGMEDECENVTAADSTLQALEDKTPGTEEDDSFEATPKGTKSMADEIEIESEFENGNVYGSENVDPFSGGDTEAGSFTNQNEYNQEPNSNVGYSQPTNGVEDWQGYGGENQQEGGSFDNNPPPIDYDENWLEDGSGFPFGFLILLLFLGVGFFIFRKSQSSRLQENSRGGYQRVGRRIDIQDHNKRY